MLGEGMAREFTTPVPSPGATGQAGLTGLTRSPRLADSHGGQVGERAGRKFLYNLHFALDVFKNVPSIRPVGIDVKIMSYEDI